VKGRDASEAGRGRADEKIIRALDAKEAPPAPIAHDDSAVALSNREAAGRQRPHPAQVIAGDAGDLLICVPDRRQEKTLLDALGTHARLQQSRRRRMFARVEIGSKDDLSAVQRWLERCELRGTRLRLNGTTYAMSIPTRQSGWITFGRSQIGDRREE
jgi:hypothetical protein